MTDLTKLKGKELMDQFADFVPGSGFEIRRRLEKLEACEAAIRKCQSRVGSMHGRIHCDGCDAARAALENGK